jgi:imidazolonepropionase-like amidohydrolase
MRPEIRFATALCLIVAQLLMSGCPARSRTGPVSVQTRATELLHYVVVRSGSTVARISTWMDDSGVKNVRTQFHPDTGPVIVTRLRFDLPSGAPLWLLTNGMDPSGRPVEERFEIADGVASWKSAPESGQKEAADRAIYLPVANAKWEAILPGLLKAAGTAAFLPRGRAWVEREGTFVVSNGTARQEITQYAVRGLTPSVRDRVWPDDAARLFADGEIVRSGWEGVLPTLEDSAEVARAVDRRRYVRTLRRVPERPVAIRNARLFDAVTRSVIEGTTVVVRDSTIVAVGRDAAVRVPSNAEVIDARGRMLLPGLWDMHSHDYGDLGGEMLQLAGGVTTIRDILRDTLAAVRFAKRPAQEVAFAPNVIWAGVLDGSGGRRSVFVTSDSSARLLVRRYAELGARQIKIYNRLQRRFVPAAVEEARRLGLRVGGHLGAGMSMEEAIRLGYDEVSHIPNLTANFRGDSVYLGAPAFLWRGIWNAATLDVESDSVRHFIALVKNSGVAVDPTLAFIEPSLRTASYRVRADVAPVLDRLPAGWRGWVGWSMEPDSMTEIAPKGFANLKTLVRKLHEAGVPVLPGTDMIAGFTLHRELQLYAEAGIPHADVLYLATLGAARVMGMDATVGSIAVGKRADMILVDGDPLRAMNDIGRAVLTMKGGAIYDPALIYRALAIEPCCGAPQSGPRP